MGPTQQVVCFQKSKCSKTQQISFTFKRYFYSVPITKMVLPHAEVSESSKSNKYIYRVGTFIAYKNLL